MNGEEVEEVTAEGDDVGVRLVGQGYHFGAVVLALLVPCHHLPHCLREQSRRQRDKCHLLGPILNDGDFCDRSDH